MGFKGIVQSSEFEDFGVWGLTSMGGDGRNVSHLQTEYTIVRNT